MPQHLFDNNDFLMNMFNAIPFPLLVVDDDVRILFWNSAALRLLGNEEIYQRRGGEVLHCIHSMETDEGCGHASFCRTCVVRNSVNESIRGGKTYRKKTIMELKTEHGVSEVALLVTTSPYSFEERSLTLLILEDISELMKIGGLLPICSKCKNIRTPDNKWERVERYIKTRIIDVDFSHGLCPECFKELYPEYVGNQKSD